MSSNPLIPSDLILIPNLDSDEETQSLLPNTNTHTLTPISLASTTNTINTQVAIHDPQIALKPSPMDVVIRSVWYYNLDSEFQIIRSLIDSYPIISMDTEFPGVLVRPNQIAAADNSNSNSNSNSGSTRNPPALYNYAALKANVDRLKLIQIGLTLSDKNGNLPTLGGNCSYIWEFNFCDFDIRRDLHAADSVELLRRQGMDFEINSGFGIESVKFAELMMSSGLICNDAVTWVTFHSGYDFGYLVKMLTWRELPEKLGDFVELVKVYCGERVFDVKHLLRFCGGLHGGLEKVCKSLNVERLVGQSHQAGSDSLLTLHAFQTIRAFFFADVDSDIDKFAGVLYGLEID